jgi:hypothetical protein
MQKDSEGYRVEVTIKSVIKNELGVNRGQRLSEAE